MRAPMTNAWSEWHWLAEFLVISSLRTISFLGWMAPAAHFRYELWVFLLNFFFLHIRETSNSLWMKYIWTVSCSNYYWNNSETQKACLVVSPDGANACSKNVCLSESALCGFSNHFNWNTKIKLLLPFQYRVIYVDSFKVFYGPILY